MAPSTLKLIPFLLAAAASILLSTPDVLAQAGTVEGRVASAATGEGLTGVNVGLEGTPLGAATDADGLFLISDVPPGTHTLVASSVGYETARQPVEVQAGEAVRVDVRLEARPIELDPVLVTGEKLQRGLEETFSGISVLDQDQLSNAGLADLEDAFRLAANVGDADFLDAGFLIRGISSEGVAGPSGDPLATVYVDGVPQTRNGARRGALGTWDLDQIEVWKGPQSTLSGRNALAGKIALQSSDPTMVWEAAALAEAGSRARNRQALMLSGPIIDDRLAFRVAAERYHSEGEIDYPLYEDLPRLSERANDDYRQVRGKLLFRPTGPGGLRALLTLSTAYDSPEYYDVDGPSADASAVEGLGAVAYESRVWGFQSAPVFVEARSTRNRFGSLQLDLPLRGGWSLAATTGLVRTITERPSVDLSSTGELDETELSQELRATYAGTRLEAVVGAFLLSGDLADDRDQRRPWEDVERRDRRDVRYTNRALFGEARWRLLPALTLIGGARYDAERQSFDGLSRQVTVAGDTVRSESAEATEADFGAFLPKLGLALDLGPQHTTALTVQRAYRAGGSAIDRVAGEVYDYDPEYAWNYELALRGRTSGERFRYGLNVFYLDWRSQQVNVPQIAGDLTSDIVLNAGRSTVRGGRARARRPARPRPPPLRLARRRPDRVRGLPLRPVRPAPRPRGGAVPAGAGHYGRARGRVPRPLGPLRRRRRGLHRRRPLALVPRRRPARRAPVVHARQPPGGLARGAVVDYGLRRERAGRDLLPLPLRRSELPTGDAGAATRPWRDGPGELVKGTLHPLGRTLVDVRKAVKPSPEGLSAISFKGAS